MALCFDLMQEVFIAEFIWFCKKLGIIEKDEDDISNMTEEIHPNSKIDKTSLDCLQKRPEYNRNSPAPSYSSVIVSDRQLLNKFCNSYLQASAQK